jgi:hypothetical protein
MRGICLCLLAVFGLLAGASAWAGSAALLKCQSEADPDRRIGICTQVIQSATPAGDELALAYVGVLGDIAGAKRDGAAAKSLMPDVGAFLKQIKLLP